MSDDIPICCCGHVSAHHVRKEPFIPSRPKLGPCVKRGCFCQEFEDEMEEVDA